MHLVLNFPLDGIVIDHFYSVPAECFRHFSSFKLFLRCRNYIELDIGPTDKLDFATK